MSELVLPILLSLVILFSLGVPLWVRPESRFYINPVPFFVHFKATVTRLRRVVFSVFLIWAVVDAILGFKYGWTTGAETLAPLWGRVAVAIAMFFLSLCVNLLFMAVVALVWDWAARRWKHPATHN